MRAIVLSIGSELLRGDITDRNAAFLTRQLARMNVQVLRVRQEGDDLDTLARAFREAAGEVEFVVSTGGLGPTADDLTRQAIAAAMGEELYVDEHLVDELRSRFKSMGRRMPESNLQQATLIPSATALPNPRGSAPGWFVRGAGTSIAALPGPPFEMEPMWEEQVRPRLEGSTDESLAMLALVTFGLGESAVEERIRDVIDWRPDVTIATYAKAAGVEIHLTARARDQAESAQLLRAAEELVRERLGEWIFGSGTDTLASVVGRLLRERHLNVGTMESVTSGAVASMLTDIEGSSEYFLGGIVAYSRDVKARYGVPDEIMESHGLVSPETALAMARAARASVGSSIGIGTTGIAGSESVEGKPSGTVYVAAALEETEEVREITRPGDRSFVKSFAAQSALDLVRRQLLAARVS